MDSDQQKGYSRQIPFQIIKFTSVHVFAPTEDVDEQIKDEFCGRLQDVLDSGNEHDILIPDKQKDGALRCILGRSTYPPKFTVFVWESDRK